MHARGHTASLIYVERAGTAKRNAVLSQAALHCTALCRLAAAASSTAL